MAPETPIPPCNLAVIAFDRISPFHLSVPCAVFEARPDLGVPPYNLRVCGAEPGPLRTSAGFEIRTRHGLGALSWADTIIVPSWRDPLERPPETLLRALQRAHARGARIVGLCLGAFVLAEAGLLDGRPATTHWHWADLFSRRFPQVRLDADVLYVDDGEVLTSAGAAAGIDCCLHLLRSRCGAEVANAVARRMVVQPHRQGGQAQFIEQPVPPSPELNPFTETLAWARAHLDRPHSLDSLAERARMSRRSFTRRFQKETGTTVWSWLMQQRLAFAQRLLETTDHPIDHVATLAGFGSAVSLRLRFREALGTAPIAYRRSFRGR
ncbi:transcriptional regulator [Geothrix limicola]|uniref:Transcriptional regulator n=1 Tax=Geothrix limicola TaxID=2927978 RepID=A0ABQ5QF44_9BACT|nr:helix-turn-helix domain-containing protein [Geothrix limicola]GLH73462.1 transcriptional regulator [Geothrix limicola]